MNDSHIQVSKDKVDEMDTRKVKKSTLQRKKTLWCRKNEVFKYDRFTTPVTFEFVPNIDSNNLNVYENHKKVFAAIKNVDSTTNYFTKLVNTF